MNRAAHLTICRPYKCPPQTVPYTTKPQVRGLPQSPNPSNPPNSGPTGGSTWTRTSPTACNRWGDGRVLMFSGPLDPVHRITRRTGAQFVSAEQLRHWLGGGPPHPALNEFPTAALLAAPGTIILPHHLPSPNIGHHGGITPQELLIPLLVA